MSLGERFEQGFIGCYSRLRAGFPDPQWRGIWPDGHAWNCLMLWNPSPPQTRPLLEMVADAMGLNYWNVGEPFRVDAVFVGKYVRRGSVPFPTLVAIEHEHTIRTIDEEIVKLLHIRCPLKVCITYGLHESGPIDKVISRSRECIQTLTGTLEGELAAHVSEDLKTTYLYLLGIEARSFELEWHALRFLAGEGAKGAEWHVLAA